MAMGQYYLAIQRRHSFSMWKNLQYQSLGKWVRRGYSPHGGHLDGSCHPQPYSSPFLYRVH